ncbi:adhesin biosynthesis transcription regulatory family protein [Escherichia coli]|nr:adhesin biosynthesis transcription regulatory family protein [Escherichia coli]
MDEAKQRENLFLTKIIGREFSAGKVSELHFWLLMELSPIRSEKAIYALRDFLVQGCDRRDACNRYGISLSYFSNVLARFLRTHMTASQLASYYSSSEDKGVV